MSAQTFTANETIAHFQALLDVLNANTFTESQLELFRDLRNTYVTRFGDDLQRNPRNIPDLIDLFSRLNQVKDRVDLVLYPED